MWPTGILYIVSTLFLDRATSCTITTTNRGVCNIRGLHVISFIRYLFTVEWYQERNEHESEIDSRVSSKCYDHDADL